MTRKIECVIGDAIKTGSGRGRGWGEEGEEGLEGREGRNMKRRWTRAGDMSRNSSGSKYSFAKKQKDKDGSAE